MATYWVKSGTGGTDAGTSWANAAESIPGLMTAQAIAGGDIIYVHNTHNYLAGAAISWTLPESGTGLVQIICVDGGDATGASLVDGTVGNQKTGAVESTNGNFAFTIAASTSSSICSLFVHGMTIKTGAGASSANADMNLLTGSSNAALVRFSACDFWIDSSNTGALPSFGNTNASPGMEVEFLNCTFRFGATAQIFTINSMHLLFAGCSISASGSSPTTLLNLVANSKAVVKMSGCDWSLATNLVNQANAGPWRVFGNNCVIGTPTTGTHPGYGQGQTELQACAAVDGTNGADMLAYYKEDAVGIVEDDQTVYRTTGGAQGTQDDGTATNYSLKLTPSSYASCCAPLYTPWVYRKIAATGSKTLTVVAADTEAAVLKDNELWLEVEYVGGAQVANSPHSQREGTFPLQASSIYQDATAAGSNLTDTGEAWTGITETGTYSLAKTVTIDEQGYVRWRVALAKATTNPVYVDTKLAVA